jgi:hypothetical protein
MPFDPTKPVAGELIDADFLRAQMNALNAKIDVLTATVAAQAVQIAAHDIAISQRLKSSDAVTFFASSISGTAGDATAFDDPPTQAQIEALRDNFNAVVAGLQAV